MQKVETNEDWCEIDELDGVRIEDGEVLEVEFPDGFSVTQLITVRQHTDTANDMGHHVDIPVSRAYVKASYHGLGIEVPIAGMKARRVNPPTYKKPKPRAPRLKAC